MLTWMRVSLVNAKVFEIPDEAIINFEDAITPEQMDLFAKQMAKQFKKKKFLVVNGRIKISAVKK